MLLILTAVCALLALGSAQDGSDIPDFLWDETTILDEYVHREDGAFSWQILDIYRYEAVSVYILNMTSQLYLNESMTNRWLWWHVMGVAIPDNVQNYETAVTLTDGGSNNDPGYPGPLSSFNLASALFANDTGMAAAYMFYNPNQPCIFYDDPDQRYRSEDDYIAYTWWWVLNYTARGQEPPTYDIIARNAMTKAAKRANDATAELARQIDPRFNITKFIVSGASKRGWTAWSVAAADRRVIATVPLVMSLLYFEEVLMGHFRAMDGAWSFALEPYHSQNLTNFFGTDYAKVLYDLEDPFRYRTRLSLIPKYMVLCTGDEFFLNQDTLYWWHLMNGYKWMMMNPNCEHSMFPWWLKIFDSAISWIYQVVYDGADTIPSVTWELQHLADSAEITLRTNQVPSSVQGFDATTPLNGTKGSPRCDYRLIAGHPEQYPQPIFWSNGSVDQIDEYTYQMNMPTPIDNEVWTAFFIETQFESEHFDRMMVLTSQVLITPDELPGPTCSGLACYGTLV